MQQLSQRNDEHLRRIVTIDENCVKIQDQAARVKSDVQQLVPSLVAAIETKQNEIVDAVENKVKESLGLSGEQKHMMEKEVKMH